MYILSIAYIRNGEDLKGGITFAILINFKHIFLYIAPVYFFYLLGNYCYKLNERPFKDEHSFYKAEFRKWSTCRFITLSLSVSSVFLLSFGPFIANGQLLKVLSRLFPVQRGLVHSYWAPNVWAFYNFVDKCLTKLLKREIVQPSLTRGLVGDSLHQVLPNVSPVITIMLTLGFMAPVLYKVFKRPVPSVFPSALNYCLMCSFLFGWHVHEKAILMVTVPLGLLVLESKTHFNLYAFLSTIGHFSLFPLLFQTQETPIKFALMLLHLFVLSEIAGPQIVKRLQERRIAFPLFGTPSFIYLYGFVVVQAFVSIIHPLFLSQWEFLPLMVMSVYCSVGILWSWWFSWYVFEKEYQLAMSYLDDV